MTKRLYSAADIARELGCTAQTVTRAAVRHGIGLMVSGVWLFSPAEKTAVSRKIRKNPGCPKFVPGNELWRRRKRTSNCSEK